MKCCHISRTAQIVAKGSMRSLSIKGDGVSKTFVQGKLGQVKVQLTGISEAHLDSTSGLPFCFLPLVTENLWHRQTLAFATQCMLDALILIV